MPTADFTITSADPSLPRRLLGVEPRVDAPRQIHNAGVVLFHGTSAVAAPGRQRHSFTLEFGTDSAAAVLANWMWTTLHRHVATLEIGGESVPVQNAAIKRALLMHASDV